VTWQERAVAEWGEQQGVPKSLTLLEGIRWVLVKRCVDEAHADRAFRMVVHLRVPRTPDKIDQQMNRAVEATRQ
jgi:hypothetical protein